MTGSEHGTWRRTSGALVASLGLVLFLSACAPEPAAENDAPANSSSEGTSAAADTETPSPSTDATEPADSMSDAGMDATAKGGGGNGQSWPERASQEDLPKKVALPASFPTDRFPIPAGAVVDDTGERADGEWYLVLRAPDQATADAHWQSIVSGAGFTVESSSNTADGGASAHLVSPALSVDAVTIPQPDGSVLLSYDLANAG